MLLYINSIWGVVIVTLGFIGVSYSEAIGDANAGPTELPVTSPAPRKSDHPVSVNILSNIGKPGALFFSLDVTSMFVLNYTLRCLSLETSYTLNVITLSPNVARIASSVFNISCTSSAPYVVNNLTQEVGPSSMKTPEDVTSEAGIQGEQLTYIGYVQGQINVTIVTNNIGRSILLVLADKISGVDPPNRGQASDLGGDPNAHSGINGSASGHPAPGGMPQLPPNTVARAMIIVMQLPRTIDTVFRVVLYIVIIMATTGMGVSVEISVIKAVLRRPVAPIIGLVCQYVGMPLIAFLIAKTIPQESPAVSLGIFTCGIVPGGGTSNMFTYLLGGDLSLSIAMTTISSIAGLAMIPFWIFTLGSLFKDDTVTLKIPYENILETLAIAILPIFLGMFFKYKIPKLAKLITKTLKPVLIAVVLFMTGLGIYTNMFMFKMIKPMTIAAGCLLPYIGYLVGGLVALLFCQSWTRVKTIAIETGIQNMGIAFLIVFLSLPPPDNQLAVVGPASSVIMTPLPLLVLVACYIIYQRIQNKKKEKQDISVDINDTEGEPLTNPLEEKAKEISSFDKDTKSGICKIFKKSQDADKTLKKKEAKKAALKKLSEGESPAAIVILWLKLTKSKQANDPVKKCLEQETVVTSLEKGILIMENLNGEETKQ